FLFYTQQKLSFWIEWPGIGLLFVLLHRNSPDRRRRRGPVRAATPLTEHRSDALFVDGEADGFHKRLDGSRRVRVGEHDSMYARSQHLLEHPGIGANRRFVQA